MKETPIDDEIGMKCWNWNLFPRIRISSDPKASNDTLNWQKKLLILWLNLQHSIDAS